MEQTQSSKSVEQHSRAMLTSLPMELIGTIFSTAATSDTGEELKKDYHLRRCEKARNLLTLCKKFYTNEQLHTEISSFQIFYLKTFPF